MSEVADGKAEGACGCGDVVSGVGEENAEMGFMEMNLSGHYVYGCPEYFLHNVRYLQLMLSRLNNI